MKRFKTLLIALMFTCSSQLSGLAAASPAQDLFDQAAYLLIVNYGGFSSATPKALEVKFQLELDQVCATQVQTCPYTAAHPVIVGMVEALADKHTNFLPSETLTAINGIVRGTASAEKSVGLYTVAAYRSASRIVIGVFPDGPAAKAGVQRGDRIVAVNGRAVSRFKDQIFSLLAGQNGGVRLLILRAGKSFTARLEPEALPPLPGASLRLRPDGIAVLQIPTFFLADLGLQVQGLLREARAKNARGLILDLRDNGGGLLSEYVRVVGGFVPDPGRNFDSPNPLRKQSLQFRDGNLTTGPLEVARANPNLWTGPLVVLVNAGSASASEFLAHDLQRYAKATVIGEVTYGVGNTLTSFFPLEDGSGLQITLAKAIGADGTPYPERITPDQVVADDLEVLNRTGRDALMERAVEILTK
jgi:carboxyl-terminal processing protease